MDNLRYEQLTEPQTMAVFHVQGPILVLAGPGSGKTRVITHRIAALIEAGHAPQSICAVTFTNKAADEMRQRVVGLGTPPGAHISTFHSLCVRILRRYADKAGLNPSFTIYDDSDQLKCVKQAVKESEIDATSFSPSSLAQTISSLKNKCVEADEFKLQANDFFSKTLAKVYARYQFILTENNAVDFDDLLMKTAFLLERHNEVAWQLSEQFRFLLIDEYQDTNHAQYRIAKAMVCRHNNICATGDPDQSIYRWRGADIGNILAFENDWPDAVVVKLEHNFRSTPNILKVADMLIAANKKRKQKTLISTRPGGNDVTISAYDDELSEARGLAEKIRSLIEQGKSLKDIAVFYRVNSMSRALEETFIRSKLPYQMVRGVEFYSRKEIKDLLAYLKVIINPDDEVSLTRVINTPPRGMGKTTLDKIRQYAMVSRVPFYQALKNISSIVSLPQSAKVKIAAFVHTIESFKKDTAGPVSILIERVFAESGLKDYIKAEPEAVDNIEELISAAGTYDRQADQPSLPEYLSQIALFSDSDAYDASTDRVALMTLHAAKGLEFENVFIIGLEDGLLPHERSMEDADQTEEERRLFFVGITRAKSNLNISYSRYRTIRGQLVRTVASPFLYELGIPLFQAAPKLRVQQQSQYGYEDFNDVQKPEPLFSKGQLVSHKMFGLGRVKEFIDVGENSIVVVRFNTGQTKSLMVKYAGLSEP